MFNIELKSVKGSAFAHFLFSSPSETVVSPLYLIFGLALYLRHSLQICSPDFSRPAQ